MYVSMYIFPLQPGRLDIFVVAYPVSYFSFCLLYPNFRLCKYTE
jgi:hypothetical protein